MPVRRFLERLAENGPAQRADIVRALARVYLTAPLDADDRRAAETALITVLDDPAPRVRRALAEALADSPAAPRAIVLALADDQPAIAEVMLTRSPVLSEPDLVDLLGAGDERCQLAIASREEVQVGLAAAVAEIAGPDACLTLLCNPGAVIAPVSFRRLVDRHCRHAGVRSALLERDDLPLVLRRTLIDGLSDALGDLVSRHDWLSPDRRTRLLDDARERALVNLSIAGSPEDLRSLVVQLAEERRLTPALMVRAACLGSWEFFAAALSVLSGMPEHRVSALLRDRTGTGLPALYRRARLPQSAFGVMGAVVAQYSETGRDRGIRRPMSAAALEDVLVRCRDAAGPEAGECLALVSRLAAEAARAEARAEAGYFKAA